MLSLVGLGLIYVFGLAFPIYNFFSTLFWRLQYFKWVKLQNHDGIVQFVLQNQNSKFNVMRKWWNSFGLQQDNNEKVTVSGPVGFALLV